MPTHRYGNSTLSNCFPAPALDFKSEINFLQDLKMLTFVNPSRSAQFELSSCSLSKSSQMQNSRTVGKRKRFAGLNPVSVSGTG